MFALLRVKKAKKYAAEQKRAAKMIEQVNAAEKEILRAREDQEIAEHVGDVGRIHSSSKLPGLDTFYSLG